MPEPELIIDVESRALGVFGMTLTFHARVTERKPDPYGGEILTLERRGGGDVLTFTVRSAGIAWPDPEDRSAEWIKVTLQAVEP